MESRRQLAVAQEELKKAQEKNRLAMLRAPIDGRVAHLSVHTVGGVVTAAQAVMEIVPDQAVPEVEAWVQNKDICFVQKGQCLALRLVSFYNFYYCRFKFALVFGRLWLVSFNNFYYCR